MTILIQSHPQISYLSIVESLRQRRTQESRIYIWEIVTRLFIRKMDLSADRLETGCVWIENWDSKDKPDGSGKDYHQESECKVFGHHHQGWDRYNKWCTWRSADEVSKISIINTNNETGDEGSQSPHNFKSASFSIPTTCGYCKVSPWIHSGSMDLFLS